LVELCKGLKLTVFTLIGLIAILANPAFSFDKTHHKSSDSGINFQVPNFLLLIIISDSNAACGVL
jgi:hypothetical protein